MDSKARGTGLKLAKVLTVGDSWSRPPPHCWLQFSMFFTPFHNCSQKLGAVYLNKVPQKSALFIFPGAAPQYFGELPNERFASIYFCPMGWMKREESMVYTAVLTWLWESDEWSVDVVTVSLARNHERHAQECFTADLQRRTGSRQRKLLHRRDVHV